MDRTPAAPPTPYSASPLEGIIRSRVANACDGCKARKVKCDGRQPCGYCVRRQRPHACHYKPQPRARRRWSAAPAGAHTLPHSPSNSTANVSSRGGDVSPPDNGDDGSRVGSAAAAERQSAIEPAEDDTEVPREARLLCDAQGKLIFIGDCAPLSLFQSVRRLVTYRVGQDAFAPETSRFSVLENVAQTSSHRATGGGPPDVRPIYVAAAVSSYISATTGMVDLFDEARLIADLLAWANTARKPRNLTSVINYLVLAIGRHKNDEASSRAYFEYAKNQSFATLGGDLDVSTVQAFVLITVYMLCSCQISSAFLVFGVSVRAAYSIGIHRTEVNARFGPEIHRQRDRLWKSLRVVDLFMSTSMGRPPATSDVDCTVPYRSVGGSGDEAFDLLNASVQIFLIIEGIVTEIYSRKKISLVLTEGISLRLREWSARWLQRLKHVVARPSDHSRPQVNGACQVLSSYHYAVMLVSRPFLMWELFRRLGDGSDPASVRSPAPPSGKSRLADACIDAASLMVGPVVDLIEKGFLEGPMPLLVSWLFASSLVLGVGLLGDFGRILEKYTRMSIQALDHFAKFDTHATQYSLIAQSLLTTALVHLEKCELQERSRRTESSSQLFGLIPYEGRPTNGSSPVQSSARPAASTPAPVSKGPETLQTSPPPPQQQAIHMGSPSVGGMDPAFFGFGDALVGQDGDFWNMYEHDEDSVSALNLFPLLDAGGGIDLAHCL